MLFVMTSARKCILLSHRYFCALQLGCISCYFFSLLLIQYVHNSKHMSSPIQINPSMSFSQVKRAHPSVQTSSYIYAQICLYQQSS